METNPEWEKYIDNLLNNNETTENSKSKGIRTIHQSDGFDTARVFWGGSWRLPTKEELDEFIDKCQWNWTSDNGVNGYRVTGPNGKSIFFPSCGWINNNGKKEQTDEQGYYWTGSYRGTNGIICIGLHFISPLKENGFRSLVGLQKSDSQ